MAGGFGNVEVRAVEDNPGLVVAGTGQGVEQRGAGRFIQADGLRGDLRHLGEVLRPVAEVTTCSTGWLPMR